MNSPLKKLQQEAQLLKLSSTEKAALHANLMKVVHASTEAGDASAPRMTPSPFYFFSPQFAMPFAALLVVFITGGTALAAKGSLPGDALYTIKTNVSEPLMGALAFSNEDKIKFHTEVAQTRLEEAEVLASQNRLDATAAATIETNLDTHLAERNVLTTKLDSSIAAHGDVLLALGESSSSSTTRTNSDAIASKVRFARGASGTVSLAMAKATTREVAPMMAPTATGVSLMMASEASDVVAEDAAAPTTSEENTVSNSKRSSKEDTSSNTSNKQSRLEKEALALEKRATSSLETLRQSVKNLKTHVDEDIEAKLDARLARITSFIALGREAMSDKDFESAIDDFNEALDREATLSTFIAANQKFNNGILGNLLGNDSRWGDDERE